MRSANITWGCGAVSSPDAAFCGMRLPRTRQAMSRRHVATSRSWGFGTTVRFFSIFRLLHLILKGGLVGCCNQGSWSGSDQSQDIYCQTRNITKYFSESKYSKWNRALRVAACRGLQEMDVLSSSLRADSEPRRSDLIP